MDGSRWLRLITIGLILAALLVGYLLLTGNFVKSKQISTQKAIKTPASTAIPGIMSDSSTPSASERMIDRSQGKIQTLPKTGFPIGLAVVFSVSAIISGWSLSKFPH